MATMSLKNLYEWHIKPLSLVNRLRLMELMVREMVGADTVNNEEVPMPTPMPKRDIMELHGLGAEIWQGIDAQEYVNQLREEWDDRP